MQKVPKGTSGKQARGIVNGVLSRLVASPIESFDLLEYEKGTAVLRLRLRTDTLNGIQSWTK